MTRLFLSFSVVGALMLAACATAPPAPLPDIGAPEHYTLLWENDEVILLPMHQNRDFSWGLSINEAGWIVGWSTDVDGNEYANLWAPLDRTMVNGVAWVTTMVLAALGS